MAIIHFSVKYMGKESMVYRTQIFIYLYVVDTARGRNDTNANIFYQE